MKKEMLKDFGESLLYFAAGFTITTLIVIICRYFNISEFMTGFFAGMGYFVCKDFYDEFIKDKKENENENENEN